MFFFALQGIHRDTATAWFPASNLSNLSIVSSDLKDPIDIPWIQRSTTMPTWTSSANSRSPKRWTPCGQDCASSCGGCCWSHFFKWQQWKKNGKLDTHSHFLEWPTNEYKWLILMFNTSPTSFLETYNSIRYFLIIQMVHFPFEIGNTWKP